MKVLIWHNAIETVATWQTAFGVAGHDVKRAHSADRAIDLLRLERFDVLLFDFVVGREGGLSVALMAEFHQPDIVSILVSYDQPYSHGGLFGRLSGLRCVLGAQTLAKDLVAIAEDAVLNRSHDSGFHADRTPQLCSYCQVRDRCERKAGVGELGDADQDCDLPVVPVNESCVP